MPTLTTTERLSLARELEASGKLLQAPGIVFRQRTLLTHKVASLRALLLGRRAPAALDELDLFNPAEALAVLRRYSTEQLAAAPESERAEAGAYIRILAEYLRYVDVNTGSHNRQDVEALLAAAGREAEVTRTDGFQVGLVERLAGDALAALNESVAQAGALQSERKRISAAIESLRDARVAERGKAIGKLYEQYEATLKRLQAEGTDPAAIDAAINAAWDDYSRACGELRAQSNAQIAAESEDMVAQLAMLDAQVAQIGQAVIQQALDASPVTEEQAKAWAGEQVITKAALNRLKRSGYDPEQVRADMAEFYRLTGGRLAAVQLQSSGGMRASANGIHGHATSVINLGERFDKGTLFHELGHHIEADPMALAAGKGFLAKRRESATLYPLRRLTGNKGYGPKEVAFKDSFYNAYVGKHYKDATEVFSMGLECFSRPDVLAQRMAEDPEHFAMMAGFLKTPPHPLFKAVKGIFAQTAKAEGEAAEAMATERAAAVKRLATVPQFIKEPADPEWTGRGWVLHSKSPSYLGSWRLPGGDFHLYDCKTLRDPSTNRRKAGLLLVFDPGLSKVCPDLPIFGGMEEALAAAAVWAKSNTRPDMSADVQQILAVASGLGEPAR